MLQIIVSFAMHTQKPSLMQECMSRFSALQQGRLGIYANTICCCQFRLAMIAGTSASLLHKRRHNKSAADVAHSDSQHARHLHANAASRMLTSILHIWMPFQHLVRECMYSQFWGVCSVNLVLVLVALLWWSRGC